MSQDVTEQKLGSDVDWAMTYSVLTRLYEDRYIYKRSRFAAQRWKTQGHNQQYALEYSAIGDDFLTKQNAKLLAVYDQQLEGLEQAIRNLIQEDAILRAQVERLTAIKGLALLSVAVLIAETNSFEGFANQRQLVSYAAGPPGGYDVIENHGGARATDRVKREFLKRVTAVLDVFFIYPLSMRFVLENPVVERFTNASIKKLTLK